ncbi:beta strand repeat-containing protein [Kineococcus sp. SYSU DK005]|uniref:beta strand repeat-containing protein n=1 Tax=Kineococcus sp. SYSU DK005 TaxID=3383126 RepID=UPI003D7E6383
MTAATSRLRRRGIGAGVAALVGLSGLGFAAVPAQAAPGFDPSAASAQVAGLDRFDTAARIARATFTAAPTVIIANGDRVIDAQAAGYLAGQNNAPILLTRAGDVPQVTLDAIRALGATRAFVLGDNVSVSAAARTQLTAAGLTLTAIAGDNRFDTAADIYNVPTTKAKTVFLARGDVPTGQVSPDALAAGPLAYGRAGNGIPILLTNAGSLPAETRAALVAGGVTRVVVLGNGITQAVKNQVTEALPGVAIETIAGEDRSFTAAALANSTYGQAVFNKTSAAIANGERVDALAAGPWAAVKGTPILLTLGTNALGGGTTQYLDANKATLTTATVFGDQNSVPPAFLTAARDAGGGNIASLQSLAVAPAAAATLTLANESGSTPTADDRTYTVTGLTDATQYRVTLVSAANVTVTNGVATFAIDRTPATVTSTNPDGANGQQASGNYLAAAGTVAARFASVNGGTPANNAGAGTTTSTTDVTNSAVANPVNGSITFTVDGNATESVVPVVYVNGGTGLALSAGGSSARLELNAQGVPVESFGLGGAVTYVNPAATSQTVGTATAIASVNKANNQFDAAGSTFTYKTGDTFSIGGVPATLDEFEAALSSGDTFTASYSATTAASTFALTDANPVAPTTVTAVAGGTGNTTNDITVTATLGGTGATAAIDNLVIQRALVTNGTVGSFTTIASPATDADTTTDGFQYVDTDVAAGTYRYQVAVVNDGQQSAFTANTANATSAAPAADTTSPLAATTTLITDAGFAGILDSGDVFTIRANEALALPAAGSVIRVSDGSDGSVADLVVGTNASVSLNAAAVPASPAGPNAGAAANTVLTVTLTAAPTVVTAGTTAGVAYPATITNTSGITDVAGNRLALTGTGTDAVINAPA